MKIHSDVVSVRCDISHGRSPFECDIHTKDGTETDQLAGLDIQGSRSFLGRNPQKVEYEFLDGPSDCRQDGVDLLCPP